MPSRRQFLICAAAVVAAGCTTTRHPTAAGGLPAVTAGTVTNPTGSVNGKDLSKLVDGFAGTWAGSEQPLGGTGGSFQYAVLLSNTADPCSREGLQGSNAYAPNELVLMFAITGFVDGANPAPTFPPATDLPLTFNEGQQATPDSNGVKRIVDGSVMQASKSGRAGNQTQATSGTITFTRLDSTAHEGSYDVLFGTSRVTGQFVLPWCGALPS